MKNKSYNLIYHYFPAFRRHIFSAIESQCIIDRFIYGTNGRFNVKTQKFDTHELQKNIFLGNFIVQTCNLKILITVLKNNNIILGDIKFLNAWVYAIFSRLSRKTVLFWTHGILSNEGGLKGFIRKSFYNLADGLLVYSENEEKLLRLLGYRKPVFVIGNSNYSEEDLAEYENINLDQRPNRCCYVGRVSEEKNIDDYASFFHKAQEYHLKIVGPLSNGIDLNSCFESKIEFMPPTYELGTLAKYVSDCRNFIMFSQSGLSVFTAIILGKRLIVKDYLVQKPEFHLANKYGLIETFQNHADLREKLSGPGLGKQEYKNARARFLSENSAEKVANRIEQALNYFNDKGYESR